VADRRCGVLWKGADSGRAELGPGGGWALNVFLERDSLVRLTLRIEDPLVAEGRPSRPADVDAVIFSAPGFEGSTPTRSCLGCVGCVSCIACGCSCSRSPTPPPGDPARAEAIAARPWREEEAIASVEERAESGWYHLRPGILEDYQSRQTIAARGSKDCTVNHKTEPIRKLINDLALARFGVGNRAWGALVRAGQRRPHLSLVGIAADELPRLHLGHRRTAATGRGS
jgi:hypothetical protein